jgi:hypothetical protein
MSFANRPNLTPPTGSGGGGTGVLNTGTITSVQSPNLSSDPSTYNLYETGFGDQTGGSASNTSVSGGRTLVSAYDTVFTATYGGATSTYAVLSISGFGGDPTSSFISKAQLIGQSSLDASAASYSYASGVATWQWAGMKFGFSPSTSPTLTITG